jgi:hypothetical protein
MYVGGNLCYHMRNRFDRESNPRPHRWPALMLISNIDLLSLRHSDILSRTIHGRLSLEFSSSTFLLLCTQKEIMSWMRVLDKNISTLLQVYILKKSGLSARTLVKCAVTRERALWSPGFFRMQSSAFDSAKFGGPSWMSGRHSGVSVRGQDHWCHMNTSQRRMQCLGHG